MNTTFYDFDDAKTAFLNPIDGAKPIENFPEACISTFSKEIIDRIISTANVTEIAAIYTVNGSYPVYKINYQGKDIAFYLSRVGAPACAAGFEEIISMGAKKFVFFGCCGILDSQAADGKIIVPVSGVRDEGTSYHYLAPSQEIIADKKSTDTIIKCLKELNQPYVKGKIWTTDAIYRETVKKIALRKESGCIAVEMEYTALQAVAQFRGVSFVQFLYGADSLDGDVWDKRDLGATEKNNSDIYIQLALEGVVNL